MLLIKGNNTADPIYKLYVRTKYNYAIYKYAIEILSVLQILKDRKKYFFKLILFTRYGQDKTCNTIRIETEIA